MSVIGDIPSDVIAAQFAGGKGIAQLAAEWEIDAALVETAIRVEFRLMIPRRDGGLKAPRREMQAALREQQEAVSGAQTLFK